MVCRVLYCTVEGRMGEQSGVGCGVGCTGCLCSRSVTGVQRQTQHNITKLARCGEVCHLSSGWFDCTEPSLSTALQGKQGVQGAYALVRGGSSTSNLIEPTRTTASQS